MFCYTKYQNNKYSFIKKIGSIINDKVANIVLDKPKTYLFVILQGNEKKMLSIN